MPLGTLFIISAPSGAGKTSLVKALIEQDSNICVSVSFTTRAPRKGEKAGVHYNFVSQDEFMQMLENKAFLEHAQVFDHYYGTSQQWVHSRLEQGIDVILEIDWQGAQQVRQSQSDICNIFILPPTYDTLAKRLQKRGEPQEIVERRMAGAITEMSHYQEYDYLVVNDVFTKALEDLQTIIHSHRLSCQVQSHRLAGVLEDLLKK